MKNRMIRSKLNIGTYVLAPYARSEAHIRDLKACGIDFVVCMENDRKTLDLFSKYHIGAIVSGVVPGWFGGMGENAGTMEIVNPISRYHNDTFIDHPAIWGIDVGDEPSSMDFPHYGKIIDRVNALFPNQFAYLNLYPNYGMLSSNTPEQITQQLGTKTYKQYIDQYCKFISTDYISFDFYLYSINVSAALENFGIVADACLRNKRSMWVVLQVNSSNPDVFLTENMLRFQAFTAMAFGAENITWACYTNGWWYHQVLDDTGNKTEQYEKLQRVNQEIHTICEHYMDYYRTATHTICEQKPIWMEDTSQNVLPSLTTEAFFDVRAKNGEALLIGEMESRYHDGSTALFICSASDPFDTTPGEITVCFSAAARQILIVRENGIHELQPKDNDMYEIRLKRNYGVLLIAR